MTSHSDKEARALYVRALCISIVKSTTQDIERQLKETKAGITIGALVVLRYLRHKPTTVHELSSLMLVQPATLIPVIDNLEKKGLVVRGTDVQDRRKTPIQLTKKGKTVVAHVPLISAKNKLVEGLGSLGARETAQLTRLLERLLTTVHDNPDVCAHILGNVRKETE